MTKGVDLDAFAAGLFGGATCAASLTPRVPALRLGSVHIAPRPRLWIRRS